MKQMVFNKLRDIMDIPRGKYRIAIYTTLVLILSILIYLTYNQYKKTIVSQQLSHMLGSSRSISRSIDLFIEDVQDSMEIITLDKAFIKAISQSDVGKKVDDLENKFKAYYEAQGNAVAAVCFIDEEGEFLVRYPSDSKDITDFDQWDIDYVTKNRKSYIGRARFNKSKDYFILYIYEPVFDGDIFKGTLSVAISLDEIYDTLIAPVKIGEKGYALVKDQDGTIIMHTVKEQVGMDVIESRKEAYPNLDYKELEGLIRNQLKGEEGTAIYHSYWWGEDVLRRAKKLNAYTPVKFGEQFWVVALTMSYDEIQGPINRFLSIIIGIAFLISIIIYLSLLAFVRMKKHKEELEKETRYLKELNEASEELRKKEAEINHSHKLKMIGTIAGGIAHDINNLLTPIQGYSELLLMSIPKDSEHYEDVEEIYKASQKGKNLIEQILLYSRNDNGIVKVGPVNINEVTREAVKLVKKVLPKNIRIKEYLQEECGYINANLAQIHQVIFNLCTNAFQAIKEGNGEIEVFLKVVNGEEAGRISNALQETRDYIELVVKDNGCGMDKDTKERIFEPFFTTKEIGEGTGLGLFVVQSTITKYHGTIIVESEVGIGSSFKVYLPLIHIEGARNDKKGLKNKIDSDKKLLIVDDNEDVLKFLKKGLEHIGYEVITESDSGKALRIFEANQNNFNMVITDYMMPGIKGDELARGIKKLRRDIKVILMTGYMAEREKNNKNSQFIDAFIAKPVKIDELSKIIKNNQ
jgi:two-component system, cell cycle sensor histidine kinase and response regulator CckA